VIKKTAANDAEVPFGASPERSSAHEDADGRRNCLIQRNALPADYRF
jgi:hypothetical protein